MHDRRSSYLVIVGTVRVKHPREVFGPVFLLWKKKTSVEVDGGTGHRGARACSHCTEMDHLFRDLSFVQAEGTHG